MGSDKFSEKGNVGGKVEYRKEKRAEGYRGKWRYTTVIWGRGKRHIGEKQGYRGGGNK